MKWNKKHRREQGSTAGETDTNYNRKQNSKRGKTKRWQPDEREFRCSHCRRMIVATPEMGTVHRNHCPHCLWSIHVDTKPGNRSSSCRAGMEPVALTFKVAGVDKYGRERTGDVMLVHRCTGCGTININRIAGDDSIQGLFDTFEKSQGMDHYHRTRIAESGIQLLQACDTERLKAALLGKHSSDSK